MIRALLILLIGIAIGVPTAKAAEENYTTYVVPVRGREFWRVTKELSGLTDIVALTAKYQIPVTYLLHYDVFEDGQVLESIPSNAERGLFLEITPKLALASFVNYPWETEKWERADKIFLSGYSLADRKKLIDTFMQAFKEKFGSYPSSVGAWYIDAWSLDYLVSQYHITAVLGVADQYITDGYQLWGQYPVAYYPSRGSVLEPAINSNDKIPVVKTLWASRHPVLSWGVGEKFSNYSVQVNDYARYHGLGKDYIRDLLKIYTIDLSTKLAHITLGIEAGELEVKYIADLENQLQIVQELKLTPVAMRDFAQKYMQEFPDISPSVTIEASVGNQSIIWEANMDYRKISQKVFGNTTILDFRPYHSSCYMEDDVVVSDRRQNLFRVVPTTSENPCKKLMEPTLSFKDRLKLNLGKLIPDFRVSKLEGRWIIGLRTGAETLYGLDSRNWRIGKLHYDFPQLENFLSLDDYRKPVISIYGRWKDQLKLADFSLDQAIVKDAPYGITNLQKLLEGEVQWENSLYLVK